MPIRKASIAIALTIILVLVLCILNNRYKLCSFSLKSGSCPGQSFSVMTYNIAATDSARFTADVQSGLMALIEQERPDILCLQELSADNREKIKRRLDSIYGPCEELDGRDVEVHRVKFYSHFKMRNFRRYHCDGAIDTVGFSISELEECEQMQRQMDMMSAEFEVSPDRWVTVFSGQLRSSAYSTARRSMDKDACWFEGIPLYKRNYTIGKRIRDYEASNVSRFIADARSQAQSVIVAGDLNDWCGSDCLETLMGSDLKDAWWEGGTGPGWTYLGWHLRLRLDHILYSDDMKLLDVKVIDSDLSDHRALVARFWRLENIFFEPDRQDVTDIVTEQLRGVENVIYNDHSAQSSDSEM